MCLEHHRFRVLTSLNTVQMLSSNSNRMQYFAYQGADKNKFKNVLMFKKCSNLCTKFCVMHKTVKNVTIRIIEKYALFSFISADRNEVC